MDLLAFPCFSGVLWQWGPVHLQCNSSLCKSLSRRGSQLPGHFLLSKPFVLRPLPLGFLLSACQGMAMEK